MGNKDTEQQMTNRLGAARRLEHLFLLNNERRDENAWLGDSSMVTRFMFEI